MPTKPFIIAGRSILIEYQDIDASDNVVTSRPGVQVTRGGIKGVEVARDIELADLAQELEPTVEAILRPVAAALSRVSADEWGVELSIGFKGSAGIPFLASGEANGSVKVSAKWKKA